ncbi:uncharacterized protein [Drosophila tropicalis]|uniref:uncharacterized protein n=1 Tax=Drosophila tropicalis TaxID=46794 RepID=UPI0035AB9266
MTDKLEMTLNDLNDDAIDLILNLLQLDELLSMYNEINPRLNDAIERQFYRFRHFDFSMRFPPRHDAGKLQALGRHLRSLHISVGYSIDKKDVIPILRPLCQGAAETQKLRALKFDHVSFTEEYVRTIQLVTPFLRILDMSHCDVRDHMIVRLLENAKMLQHLVILNIYQLTGEEHLKPYTLNNLPCLKLICIMFVGNLPYKLDELSIQYPHLSFLVYDTVACNAFKIYGPYVNIDIRNKWSHEYFKSD